VPAKPVSVVEAAFVEAWTIPAICIEANRDILDRRKRFDRRLGAQRRAQRRRLDRALDESPCCQHGRRSKSQKTVHRIDPPWIAPPETCINAARIRVGPCAIDHMSLNIDLRVSNSAQTSLSRHV
jgi:hypothetical protein